MREVVSAIEKSTSEIADSTKQIALLERESAESRQALSRTFEALSIEIKERKAEEATLSTRIDLCAKDFGDRMKEVEREMPLLKLTKTITFSLLALSFLELVAVVWSGVLHK